MLSIPSYIIYFIVYYLFYCLLSILLFYCLLSILLFCFVLWWSLWIIRKCMAESFTKTVSFELNDQSKHCGHVSLSG